MTLAARMVEIASRLGGVSLSAEGRAAVEVLMRALHIAVQHHGPHALYFYSAGGRMTKRFTAGGELDPDHTKGPFDVTVQMVSSLEDVRDAVLECSSDMFLLNARPVDPFDRRVEHRRITHEAKPHVEMYDCSVVFVDLDLDTRFTEPDLKNVYRKALQCLPGAFQGVRCLVLRSAKTGMRDKGHRARLCWFSDRPVSQAEIKNALHGCPGVDPRLYDRSHPNYVAAPIFDAPWLNPFHWRDTWLIVEGRSATLSLPRTLPKLASAGNVPREYAPIRTREGRQAALIWFGQRVAAVFGAGSAHGRETYAARVYGLAGHAWMIAHDPWPMVEAELRAWYARPGSSDSSLRHVLHEAHRSWRAGLRAAHAPPADVVSAENQGLFGEHIRTRKSPGSGNSTGPEKRATSNG